MATTQPIYDHFTNPVDMVEHIATIHDWTFERSAPDELTLTVSGSWCDYHISLTWRDDLEALHLACAFDFRVPKPRLSEIYKLMALINEQLWLGHFDLWKDDGLLLYRPGLLLAGADTGMTDARASASGTHGGGAGRRILIIDDNHDAADSMATLLQLWGHQTWSAHDGGRRSDGGPTSGIAVMKTRPCTKAGATVAAGRP